MNPMDEEFIEKHDVTQRYLHGKLTPEEAEVFEVYLMEHPDTLTQVELDSVLNQGLRSLPAAKTKTTSTGLFGISLRFVAVPFAAFWLGIYTTYFWSVAQDNAVISIAQPHLLDLSSPRSSENLITATYQLNENEDLLLLLLSPEVISTEHYVVTLTDQNDKILYSDSEAFSSADGNIYLTVPTEHIEVGIISVVFALNESEATSQQARINVIR